MGIRLQDSDEYIHDPGPETNWNESRYVDFFDSSNGAGGWLRLGTRPNQGFAEMSACVSLPTGGAAFMYGRPAITGNGLAAGGQTWGVDVPFGRTTAEYVGSLILLPDPWALAEPGAAFRTAEVVEGRLSLISRAGGLTSVMGADQADIERIFLPGQAAFHYQHLVRTTGTVQVGSQRWAIDGLGGRDHSWGPRNWHAKTYLRWLIAMVDEGTGFMLTRAVGPGAQTRGGFVWDNGTFRLVDNFELRNSYADAPHYEMRSTAVRITAGPLQWTATGTPTGWLPLRHRQDGNTLRIVKSPTRWTFGDGRAGAGMCEYHDLLDGVIPVGLHD